MMEPVVDVLGLVYLKEEGALGTFTILDRTMPLYICFVYPWYVGGLGYLAYRIFQHGVTMKDLFGIWAVDAVIDVFLESPGILAGTYLYYGHQPFDIWGFPLWWGFVNPVMPMLAGALIYQLRPHLDKPWKLPAVIPFIPMADGIANGATAWPMWAALNQTTSRTSGRTWRRFATLGLSLFCGLDHRRCPSSAAASSAVRRRRCGKSSKRSYGPHQLPRRHRQPRPCRRLKGKQNHAARSSSTRNRPAAAAARRRRAVGSAPDPHPLLRFLDPRGGGSAPSSTCATSRRSRVQGGVCIFQGTDNVEYTDMAYLDYEITMPWPGSTATRSPPPTG